MATTVREYSLDYYLFDRMRFSGIERENLEDLVSIVTSLKNKYGIVPFAVTPQGQPVPNGLTARYLIETIRHWRHARGLAAISLMLESRSNAKSPCSGKF